MQWRTTLFGLIVAAGLASAALANAQNDSGPFRADEYDTVALIYNEELSAVGDRALFPICIEAPSDIHLKALLKYLRRGGYPIMDISVCNPNIGSNGKHPRDYPHGMSISLDHLYRHPDGKVDLHVATGDLTLRPGLHVAVLLRRGTYHFNRNKNDQWEIVGYTKEYDYKDDRPFSDCEVSQPAAKDVAMRRVSAITVHLLEISEERVERAGSPDRPDLNKKIDLMLNGESDPDVLARVALISNTYLLPGNAGDEAFDDVFDVAWEACIRRIEQIGGKSAMDALETIQANMRLDGSYSLQWKASMERLKAKQNSPR